MSFRNESSDSGGAGDGSCGPTAGGRIYRLLLPEGRRHLTCTPKSIRAKNSPDGVPGKIFLLIEGGGVASVGDRRFRGETSDTAGERKKPPHGRR